MLFNIVKVTVSAILIAIITEIAKKNPNFGGILAALPIISFLSLIWLSAQGGTMSELIDFTKGVIMGLPATIFFVLGIFFSLKLFHSLPISFICGLASWGTYLVIQNTIIKFLNT